MSSQDPTETSEAPEIQPQAVEGEQTQNSGENPEPTTEAASESPGSEASAPDQTASAEHPAPQEAAPQSEASADTSSAEPASEDGSATQTAEPDASQTEEAGESETGETDEDGKPKVPRIKIGSQRHFSSKSGKPKSDQQGETPTDDYKAKQQAEEIPELSGSSKPAPASGPVPKPNLRHKDADIEDELNEALEGQSLDDIAKTVADAPERLERNTKTTGKVLRIHDENVFVDVGARNQGVVGLKQFAEKPPEVGETVEVIVGRFDEDDGLYQLNLRGGASEANEWEQLSQGMIVEARVTGTNKGGLQCAVGNLKAFMPASQISMYRVDNLESCVGEKYKCVITECNPQRKNLVLSARALMERERQEAREKLRNELEEGQVREGIVRNIKDFGAFVDLGGLDGLLHIGQMSWARIKHPSELLENGQKIKVKILKIDPDSGKISLSLKDLQADPWTESVKAFPETSVVTGKVTRVMPFGAFVELAPGIEGLIHISELDSGRVWRVSDIVNEGEEVEVKVLSIDPDKRRIALSRKAVQGATAPAPKSEPEEEPEEETSEPAQPSQHKTPLKGGTGRASGGEEIGLNL